MSKEIWRDIPNYEGSYQASNLGRVRSLDRTVTTVRGEWNYKGKIMDGSVDKGYRKYKLYIDGVGNTLSASQIVAITFLGHKPNGFKDVIDHINGDTSDDSLANLQIVTQRENSSTCYRSDKDCFTSKYVGVSWVSKSSKWQAHIHNQSKTIYLGLFNSELEASKAYQIALDKINDGTFNPEDYKPKLASKYVGVTYHKATSQWMARVTVNKKQKYLGRFKTELEAYTAIQRFKTEQINEETFEDEDYYEENY